MLTLLTRFLNWVESEQHPFQIAKRNREYRRLERAELGDISANAIRSRLRVVHHRFERERVANVLAFSGKEEKDKARHGVAG